MWSLKVVFVIHSQVFVHLQVTTGEQPECKLRTNHSNQLHVVVVTLHITFLTVHEQNVVFVHVNDHQEQTNSSFFYLANFLTLATHFGVFCRWRIFVLVLLSLLGVL